MGVKVTFLREADGDGRAGGAAGDAGAARRGARPRTAPATCSSSRQDTVERRAVRPAAPTAIASKCIAGLTAGDRVVVSPPPALADGAQIVVK